MFRPKLYRTGDGSSCDCNCSPCDCRKGFAQFRTFRGPSFRACLVGALMIAAAWPWASSSSVAQTAPSTAKPASLVIAVDHIVTPVSPMLYGMMTEEINHSYDGGLYAELVRNRTFRSSWEGVEGWTVVRRGNASASMAVDKSDGPSKALPGSLKLTVTTASAGNEAGLTNAGYWGIAVPANTTFHGSFYAHVDDASLPDVTVRLIENSTGAVLAESSVQLHTGLWVKYEFTLQSRAAAPSSANHLELLFAHPGTLGLQLVSLMPPTFHGRSNGNRTDLMERMAAMHPNFLRLPGGNYLEGDTLKDWYDWKKTIGPLVDRPGHQAPWTYWSSDGLGLLEFLEWCEDLKIEPVLAVYAGYSLHGEHIAPGAGLTPYVQSALDEV